MRCRGNILIAANCNVGRVLRDVASEVAFKIDEDSTTVNDHFMSPKDQGKLTLVVIDTRLNKFFSKVEPVTSVARESINKSIYMCKNETYSYKLNVVKKIVSSC